MIEGQRDFYNEIYKINTINAINTDNNNKYYIKQLNKTKEIISDIYNETKKLYKYIQTHLQETQKYKLQKDIEENIKYLKKNNFDNIYEESVFYKQKKKFKKYYEYISELYKNNHINKIKELNENLNNILYDIIEFNFMPPTINSFNNSSVDLFKSEKFYQDINITEEKEKSYIMNCTFCNNNKESTCFCNDCNKYFCDECLKTILENEKKERKGHKHKIIYFEDIKEKNELSKTYFLNSVRSTIENILIKANDILNNEKNISLINNNNNNNIIIKYFKKDAEYPYIKNVNDWNSQIEFLQKINSNLKNELNENNKNINNSFNITKMNKELILKIKDIFFDKDTLLKDILIDIDNNFYSDDEMIEDENFAFKDEMNNQFYASINIIPIKDNISSNMINSKEKIINLIHSDLSIDKENIFVSFNNKYNFIDNFIRTKEFFEYPLERLKINFPNLNKLYELKMIVNDLFCNLCDFRSFMDYRGNFIIPNKNLNNKRGTEKYDPPYGWIGIGLKVTRKYENDDWLNIRDESSKWAIAYHGVGRMNSYEEIINTLKNIVIEEGLKPGLSQIKCHSNDIRHKGKKIGTGVYLAQSINAAEEYSGIIPFNNKKYKIVLMAKVLIDRIKQPEDINYWILNKEYVRVYRILLKEKT